MKLMKSRESPSNSTAKSVGAIAAAIAIVLSGGVIASASTSSGEFNIRASSGEGALESVAGGALSSGNSDTNPGGDDDDGSTLPGLAEEARLALTINPTAPGCVTPGIFLQGLSSDASMTIDGESKPASTDANGVVSFDGPQDRSYEVVIDGTFDHLGVTNELSGNAIVTGVNSCITSVDKWSEETNATSASYAFLNARNLTHVEEAPSTITNMSYMFRGAKAFDQDLSGWDVSSVTNMNSMFYGATVFNQDIGDWDVSSVTDMNNMFTAASNFNNGGQPLDWGDKTSKVTNMYRMFLSARSFNGNISNWDVSNVTNMKEMFRMARDFNQDLSDWDVSNVTDMGGMFFSAINFDQDISDWNVSNVTNMSEMFWNATAFNNGGQPLDWGAKVGNVTNMSGMFREASSFDQDISGWNTSNVTDMSFMFYIASSFNQDLSSWDVSKVTSMNGMFSSATAFNNGGRPLNWSDKTSKVTNMYGMFRYASSFNQDISGWDVSSVIGMSDMFFGASLFNQDLSGWDVSKVTSRTSFALNSPLASQPAKLPRFK